MADIHAWLHFLIVYQRGILREKARTPEVCAMLKKMGQFMSTFVLKRLLDLFLEEGYFDGLHAKLIRQLFVDQCKDLRKDAVALVDAWAIPDFVLKALIGKYDGDIYPAYFATVNAAQKSFEPTKYWLNSNHISAFKMDSSSTQFIAFFGATGGCANACLAHTLNAGLHATALARTPSKLTDMLLAQGVSQATLDDQLNIVEGNIADVAAIKSVLLSKDNHPVIASQIISGIGGAPSARFSVMKPLTVDDPEVCAVAVKNIMLALGEIYAEHPTTSEHKPSITVISSTGLSDAHEDVPFGFRLFYRMALQEPHKDKKEMERLITDNATHPIESSRLFRGVIILRVSLLRGDQNIKKGKGWQKVRAGTEDKPAIGYTINRADVGEWIFEQIIKSGGENWYGQKVTLTS
ncbi:hypothetical protein BGX20_000658 [Mortierella sp. AD010]|nr:hypothetical protein BGX20_000658 [Mortierella sp. AD010]